MVSVVTHIAATFDYPLERVWGFISHVPNQDQWVDGMSSSEVIGGGPVGIGSEIAGANTFAGRSNTLIVAVTRFEPPAGSPGAPSPVGRSPSSLKSSLPRRGGVTQFFYTVTLTSNGTASALLFGPLRPLLMIIARRMLRREVEHLRTALSRYQVAQTD